MTSKNVHETQLDVAEFASDKLAARDFSRRDVLRLFGAGSAVAAASAAVGYALPERAVAAATPATVANWVATRGATYQIAHRGAGDVYPEHTMSAYKAAIAYGAKAMEISVAMSSDGVLVCFHDSTLDRTTNGTGPVSSKTWAQLSALTLKHPQLGPAWGQAPLERIPKLEDVLTAVGGKAVICLEAKNDAAYPKMMALAESRGLKSSIIVKAFRGSQRIAQAKKAGYPVFVYLGQADMNATMIQSTAATLDRTKDYLVIPYASGTDVAYYPDSLIRTAVATGVPIWVYAIHRRADFKHYTALGVKGAVSSSIGYTTSVLPVALADNWSTKKVAAGQISRWPDNPYEGPKWAAVDALILDRDGKQQFITLGQLSPVAKAATSYEVRFSAVWDVLPVDLNSNLTLAFGHTDDSYYEHRYGKTTGYHAIMRPNGALELYLHKAGSPDGVLLATMKTPAAKPGQWMSFSLKVSKDQISWSRTGLPTTATVTSRDTTIRGGYMHIGRSSYDNQAILAIRALKVI